MGGPTQIIGKAGIAVDGQDFGDIIGVGPFQIAFQFRIDKGSRHDHERNFGRMLDLALPSVGDTRRRKLFDAGSEAGRHQMLRQLFGKGFIRCGSEDQTGPG